MNGAGQELPEAGLDTGTARPEARPVVPPLAPASQQQEMSSAPDEPAVRVVPLRDRRWRGPAAHGRRRAGRKVRGGVDVARLLLRPVREQLGEARQWAREYLLRLPVAVTSAALDDALLLVNELVSNAIEHGRPPQTLRLAHDDDGCLLVEVDDRSVSGAVARVPDEKGGRGLVLVAGVATAWGQTERADGKTVWAELPLT